MTDGNALKQRLKEIVGKAVDGRTSSTLREQLFQILDENGGDAQGLEKSMEKVRITIKLFVDEKLADQVSRDLRAAVTAARK